MSKKSVRVRKSFVKQWIAVISGSLLASSMQVAAQAAQDNDRPSFRSFRQDNPGIDRGAARKMFQQQFGRGGGGKVFVPASNPSLNRAGSVSAPTVRQPRADKLTRRMERRGVLKQSVQAGADSLVTLRTGVNLDLGSADRNITLGKNLFKNVGSVEISVGGETKTVSAGAEVTASEYVAVKQVLAGSGQKLVVDGSGKSVGGEVDLSSITASNDVMRASDLVVPVNVTTFGDFAKGSDFKLLGDLTNDGSIYALSSKNSVRSGAIHADDIINTGSISSYLTDDLRDHFGAKGKPVDLGIHAKGDLSNLGSITSSGNLTLTTGGTLANSGRIESLGGSVRIDGSDTAELNINNAGGTIAALGGAIEVRNPSFAGAFNTNVSGGDLLSKQLNLNAGGGVLRVNVNELTGTINQIGSEAHVAASTAELNLGDICLTGDPTFKNSAGNINITGDIIVAQDLAIIASGNITSVNNITLQATSAGTGFDITLIAGAEQLAGGTNSTTLPGGTASATSLTGSASTGGGSVLLGTGVTIDTRATSGTGGDVLIAAFRGLGFNSGRVDLAGTTILTNDTAPGIGTNGNVTIIAGAVDTNSVRVGSVTAVVQSNDFTGGVLTITTAQPVSSNGAQINFNDMGAIVSGNSLIASGTLASGANVQVAGQIDAITVTVNSGGSINLLAGSTVSTDKNFGNVNLTAAQDITAAGNTELRSLGGVVNLVSQGGNIGTPSNRVNVSGVAFGNVNAVANNGSVYLSAPGTTLVSGSAQSTFDMLATGGLIANSPISASTVSLRSSNGIVALNNSVTATASLTVRAANVLGIGSVATAPLISLRSDTSTIVASVNADNLIVNAPNGDASITESNNVNFGGGNSFVAGLLDVDAGGNISSTSSVAATNVSLTAGGSLNLASTITGTNAIDLSSVASIENANLTGTFITPLLRLESMSGNIGTSAASPLNIDANSLRARAVNGSVYISDPNSVTVGGNSIALNDFQLTAANNVISSAVVSGTDVRLTATNGSLLLNGLVSGSNSITLTSRNSITNASIAGGLDDGGGGAVPILSLTSTNASIGQTFDSLSLDAANLILNAAGGVNVATSGDTSISGPSSAGLKFDLSAAGILSIDSPVSAVGDINLESQTTVLDINDLVQSSAGGVSGVSTLALFVNNSVLAQTDVSFESRVDSLFVNAGVTATLGDITLLATNSVTVDEQLSAGRDVVIEATNISVFISDDITAGRNASFSAFNNVNIFDTISAQNVRLESENAGVFVGAQITATTSITLDSSNDILDANLNNSPTILDAPQINLISLGNIGASTLDPLDIDADNLTVNSANAFIADPGELNLGNGTSSTSLNLWVRAANNLTTTGAINAGDVLLRSTNGSVDIGADLDSAGLTTIEANLDITTQASATVTSVGAVFLDSTSGNVGTSAASRFNISAPLVSVFADSAFIDAVGNLAIDTSTLTQTFDVTAQNNLSVNNAISADDVVFRATSGSFQFAAIVTAATSASLTSGLSMLNAGNFDFVQTPELSLTVTGGDIGTAGSPLTISGTVTDLTANAPSGNVYITTPGAISIAGPSGALNDFSVTADGSLSVDAPVGANDIVLRAALGSGGSIILNDSVTGVSSISLFSDNGITSATGLVAPLINLTTTAGDIGAGGTPLVIDADTLSVVSAGDAFVSDPNDLTLAASSAVGDLEVTAAGSLSSIGTVSGVNVSLTATSGGLDLDGLVSGSDSISLVASQSILNSSISGGLDNGAGGAVALLDLLSTAGDIGLDGDPLLIDAIDLIANAPSGSVYISDDNSLLDPDINIVGASGSAGAFEITAVNGVSNTLLGTITAQDVRLTASTTALTLNGLVEGSSSITLVSAQTLDDASITGGLDSVQINLESLGADVDITTVDFTSVTANAFGSVNLADLSGSMNIGSGPSSAGTSFTASAPVNVTNDGTIDAHDVVLIATAGGFTFNNVINGTTSITLTSFDDILNGVGLGQLVTPLLDATSTDGSIGTALDPLNINVSQLIANAPTGSVFIDNGSALSIAGASGALETFSVSASPGFLNSISVDAPIDADDVILTALAGSAGFVEVNDTITAGTSITISSDDGIFDFDFAGGTLSAPRINLMTTFGSIGLIANPIPLDTSVISIQSAGNAFITIANSVDIADSSAVGTLSVVAAVDLTSSGTITAANVILEATGGGLTLNGLVRGTNSISLTSNNSILNASIAGGLDSGVGVPVNQLNLTSFAGDIGGDTGDILNVEVQSMTANAVGGSVFLSDPTSINFGPGGSVTSGAGSFHVQAGGDLTSTGSISSSSIFLTTAGSFDLDGLLTADTIILSSSGSILNSSITGGLVASTLDLTSTAGGIGASGEALAINVNTLFVTAQGAGLAGSVFVTDADDLAVFAPSSANGTFSISAGNNLSVQNFNLTASGDVVILEAGNDLAINTFLSGTTSVDLIAGNALTQSAGTISGGVLTVGFTAGATTLSTDVSSLATVSGPSLTVNEANGLVLLAQGVGTLNINASQASAGDVTTGADFSVGVLNVVNGNGNITVLNNLTGTTSITLNTSTGGGSIEQTAGVLTTPALNVLSGAGGIGGNGNFLVVTNGAGAVALNANATGGGDVHIDYSGTGLLTLSASAGNDNFTITTSGGGNIATGGNVSGTGTLTIETDNLTVSNILSFGSISISNPAPTGLTLTGATGQINSLTGTTITASAGDIDLFGTMTFNGTGDVTMTVGQFAELDVHAGANFVGINTVTVNACNIVMTGILAGNPLIIICDHAGTIANSTGDVNLASDLVIVGQNLAILAAGNVNTTGATLINLSSPLGSGSLTIMAGYDFTPATGGQVQNGDLYTISGPSATGGSINLGTVDVVLEGGAGSGGNLVAVANAGTPNAGSIALGDISTTGTNNGGSLNLIGPGGILVGDIDTQGGIASGNVSMSVANPTIAGGPITVQNGVLVSGSFAVGATTAGDLDFNDINAPGADITLRGALAAGDNITQNSGNMVANRLFVNTVAGAAIVQNSAINELNSSGGGQVGLQAEADSILINNISGATQALTVGALGSITTGATAINIDLVNFFSATGDIVLNASVGGTTLVNLDAAAGTITQSAGTVSGGDLLVAFGTGPVTLNTNVARLETVSGTSLTINEANDLELLGQTLTDLTLSLTNGNLTTAVDFTVDNLTIDVLNGTIEISNNISANVVADVFADDGITSTGGGVLAGAQVVLSSNANIGVDALDRLQIDADNFSATGSNVFINNQNGSPATMNASTATGTLDVSTAGDLATAGNVSAVNVALTTGGAFNLSNTINGSGSIALTAGGNLTNVGGVLNTPTLLLNSVNGNVGTDALNPFVVDAAVSSIGGSAMGAGGGFFVASNRTTGVNFLGVQTDGDMFLAANGGLTISNNLTSTDGAIRVEAARDSLAIASGVVVTAHDQIDIIQNGITKKRDGIVLGSNSQILTTAKSAGLGDVNIILGAVQTPNGKSPSPKKNVTIVEIGGQALFGGKKASAAGPGIVITAEGADVFISSQTAKAINIGAGVLITADPPVPAGTPVIINGQRVDAGAAQMNGAVFAGATSPSPIALSAGLNTATNTLPVASLLLPQQDALGYGNSVLAGIDRTQLQLVGLNNASMVDTAVGNNGSIDDSFITTANPGIAAVDSKFCGQFKLQGGGSSVDQIEHSQCVTVDGGSVLFAPTSDTTVVTPAGKVQIKANSVALVAVDGQHLSVFDIHDNSKRSVVIETAGRAIPLSPGKHLTVTHEGVSQFADINLLESLMHRGVSTHALGNGRKAFASEFSIPSALQTVKPLNALLQSKDNNARQVAERVMKTSAVIMQLTQNAHPYEFHARPRTVALHQ